MVHGDGELPGCCLRQTSACVGVGLGGQLDLLLARGTHPPGEPLAPPGRPAKAPSRHGLGRTRTSAPSRPNPSTATATASGPSRRPLSVVRRWWASNAAATRASSGSAGVRSTRPTTDSVSSTGHPAPAQTVTSPASSSPVSRSSSAEAVMRVAPARSPGSSRVMSDCLRLDGDRGPVGGLAGEVGGGDCQQVGVPVVHDPVLRPGQQWREPAAHRPGAAAEVVDHPAAGRREASPRAGRRGRAHGPRRQQARGGRAIPG